MNPGLIHSFIYQFYRHFLKTPRETLLVRATKSNKFLVKEFDNSKDGAIGVIKDAVSKNFIKIVFFSGKKCSIIVSEKASSNSPDTQCNEK